MGSKWKKGQTRTCNCIVKYLLEVGEAPYPRIKEHVNSTLKHGVTGARLVNILSKYPDFEKVGMTFNKGESGVWSDQSYPTSIWKLSKLE
jgi:hypothetical protein